jgi:levanase/fructan beta-fructosidase
MDVSLHFHVPESGEAKFIVNGHTLSYRASTHDLSILDKTANVPPIAGTVKLRILADRASLEIFAQEGLQTMPIFTLPVAGDLGFQIDAPKEWKFDLVEVYPLKSAWRR